jgi:outer membrane protein assembly factor BamB
MMILVLTLLYMWRQQGKHRVHTGFVYPVVSRSLLFGSCAALLILLAACGSSATGNTNSTAATLTTPVSTATAPVTTATSGTTSTQWNDWTTYHANLQRSGVASQSPTADPTSLSQAWRSELDGQVFAEPLMVHGHVIVATEGDSLYALDPATGKVLWHTNVGTPVPQSALPCGDIDPLGITGTPVYDPATNLIFAVAEVSGPQHILVALNADNGHLQWKRSADIPSMDVRAYQQRSALAIAHGMVVVTYGGHAGDCSDYKGTVVSVHTDGTGNLYSYVVPTAREAGMWTPSGPSVDAAGNIYVSVGNGASESGAWDHSDSVLKFSPTLQLESAFAPTQWAEENAHDTDLGSMGPMLLPDNLAFLTGKSGIGYLLNTQNLGGIGGQISDLQICQGVAMGGGAVAGTNAVLVPCYDGVRKVSYTANGSKMTIDWHFPDVKYSSVVAGNTVYGLGGDGTIYAVNLANGQLRAKLGPVTSVPTFTTPMISGNHLFIGTTSGVMSIAI